MGESFFSRLLGIFKKPKSKDQSGSESISDRYGVNHVVDNSLYDSGSVDDNYGAVEGTTYTNPLFDAAAEQETAETEAPAEQETAETAETEAFDNDVVREPLPNLLENIGGLPTVTSIQNMAPGIKLEKESLNKNFANALGALEEYQTLVTKQHTISVNDAEMRRTGKYFNPKVNLYAEAMSEEKLTEAEKVYLKLADFIHWTEKAVYGWKGLFTRRSDNLKRLSPVFANMLMQAYGLLPKVAHLESAVPPYLMATDQETYNFSDVINHAVTAGRSGGLAMRGYGNENSAIMLSRKDASKAAQNARKAGKLKQDGEDADIYKEIMEHRRNATREARMDLKVPTLPTEVNGQGAVKRVDAYLAELGKLMTALDDTAESAEFSVMIGANLEERQGVHDQQALNFRLARLMYLVMQHRDTLEAVVTNASNASQMPGYQEIRQLGEMAGKTLSKAEKDLNEEAYKEEKFTRLEDENGNELQLGKDYKVSGGSASTAILDRKNKRVLRAPKGFTKEKQKTALNGIKDEASGIVSRFLGFNVCAQAKAAGFVSRDHNGENPTPVFGGSIMEMADGVEADSLNLLMGLESQEFVQEHRKNDKYRNLDVMKQGKLIGEIMKMNVLDYIIMHDDRHTKNFLVNLDADETEAMVTGIDNDYVLGSDNSRQAGNHKSAHALAAIHDRIVMDNGVKLETGFPMMTQEVKETLQNLDPAALNHLLMPYADRVMRMAAVHRAAELKKYAETVETCDLTTPEGTEQYIKKAIRSSMKEWLRGSTLKDTYFNARDAANTVVRMLIDAVFTGEGARGFIDAGRIVEVMKYLGISNSEAENIMLENLSSSSTADVKITREELMASKIGKALAG